jgi:hypothetical protein
MIIFCLGFTHSYIKNHPLLFYRASFSILLSISCFITIFNNTRKKSVSFFFILFFLFVLSTINKKKMPKLKPIVTYSFASVLVLWVLLGAITLPNASRWFKSSASSVEAGISKEKVNLFIIKTYIVYIYYRPCLF